MTTTWKLPVDKKGNVTGNIITPLFRGSFVSVFEAKGIKGSPDSKKKYGLSMLFTADTAFGPLEKMITEVATAKWGAKAGDVLKKQQNGDKRIFQRSG